MFLRHPNPEILGNSNNDMMCGNEKKVLYIAQLLKFPA